MANRITRERMIEAIRELPDDATVEDAIERLVFLAKIEEGLAQLDQAKASHTMRSSVALACDRSSLVSTRYR